MTPDERYFERLRAYTLPELEEIERQIDRERFPERYDRVLEEIGKRKRGEGPLPGRREAGGGESAVTADRVKALVGFVAAAVVFGFGVRQLSQPSLRREHTRLAQGEIAHARQDSTEVWRRKSLKSHYHRYVVFRLSGDPAHFKYGQNDPRYSIVRDAVLAGGRFSVRYVADGSWTMVPVEVVAGADTLVSMDRYIAHERRNGHLMLLGGCLIGMLSLTLLALDFRGDWHGWLKSPGKAPEA